MLGNICDPSPWLTHSVVRYKYVLAQLTHLHSTQEMSAIRPLFVVAGIGNGSGLFLAMFARPSQTVLTSAQEQGLHQRKDFLDQPNAKRTNQSSSRLFGKLGYRVALISRGPEHLNKLANEINHNGGEVRHNSSIIILILTRTFTVTG